MCFSAKASFFSAGLLFITSFFTINAVREKNWYSFAVIPFLFGLQQFTEGLFWIYNNKFFGYLFLIFAQIIWPFWLPFSLWLIETKQYRKKIIGFLTILGLIWGIGLIWSLIKYGSTIELRDKHIYYNIEIPIVSQTIVGLILYCIPTLGCFFLSSKRYMYIFGATGIVSCIFTLLAWQDYFLSIWCFFAAILSILALVIIKKNQ